MDEELMRQLVQRLVTIRQQHNVSQQSVADCMGIRNDTLRHAERGRRPLPDFMHGRIDWVRLYLKCVGATPLEEKEVMELAAHEFLTIFSEWMRDLEDRNSGL